MDPTAAWGIWHLKIPLFCHFIPSKTWLHWKNVAWFYANDFCWTGPVWLYFKRKTRSQIRWVSRRISFQTLHWNAERNWQTWKSIVALENGTSKQISDWILQNRSKCNFKRHDFDDSRRWVGPCWDQSFLGRIKQKFWPQCRKIKNV